MNTSRDLEIEKQIDAYIKGRLTEDQVQALWIELFKHPKYIDHLETELSIKLIIEKQLEEQDAAFLQDFDTPADQSEAVQPLFMQSWKWLAAAASVAILVIAINFLQLDSNQSVQQLTLGDINLVENLAAPEVVRSQNVESTALDSLLNLGFKAAISGDRERAFEIYNEAIQKFKDEPKTAMAFLNMGILNYNSGDYEVAAEDFVKAINQVSEDPMLKEKAYWYLGNAYTNLGQLEEARTAIQKAHELQGIYQNPASRLLQKLDEELALSNQGGAE